ncbi:MAG: hypothetical protein OXC40_03565, partial [Proteobacteria bacterium]|nr:hypothetical protein [Pseudomonadota bacterium]
MTSNTTQDNLSNVFRYGFSLAIFACLSLSCQSTEEKLLEDANQINQGYDNETNYDQTANTQNANINSVNSN